MFTCDKTRCLFAYSQPARSHYYNSSFPLLVIILSDKVSTYLCLDLFLFLIDFIFLDQFQVHRNNEQNVQRVPIHFLIPPHTHRQSLPHYQQPPPETDEPTWTHHSHPKSPVSMRRLHSWCWIFHGCGQMWDDIHHHCSIIGDSVRVPKSPVFLLFIPPPPQSLTITDSLLPASSCLFQNVTLLQSYRMHGLLSLSHTLDLISYLAIGN